MSAWRQWIRLPCVRSSWSWRASRAKAPLEQCAREPRKPRRRPVATRSVPRPLKRRWRRSSPQHLQMHAVRRPLTERRIHLPKNDAVEMDGTIIDALPNSQFTVRLDNGHELLAYTGGRMRRFRIRILLGDRVKVEMSPYDLSRRRVSYRYR